MPRIACRVVCGRDDVIATFDPTSAFVSVDLPTLGRPTKQAKPDRKPSGSHGCVNGLPLEPRHDLAADRQRRGRRRRRGVEHVQHAGPSRARPHEQEVVDQRAVGPDGLRAHPGAARDVVRGRRSPAGTPGSIRATAATIDARRQRARASRPARSALPYRRASRQDPGSTSVPARSRTETSASRSPRGPGRAPRSGRRGPTRRRRGWRARRGTGRPGRAPGRPARARGRPAAATRSEYSPRNGTMRTPGRSPTAARSVGAQARAHHDPGAEQVAAGGVQRRRRRRAGRSPTHRLARAGWRRRRLDQRASAAGDRAVVAARWTAPRARRARRRRGSRSRTPTSSSSVTSDAVRAPAAPQLGHARQLTRPVATTTLPHVRKGRSCSAQNAFVSAQPATARRPSATPARSTARSGSRWSCGRSGASRPRCPRARPAPTDVCRAPASSPCGTASPTMPPPTTTTS